LLSILTCAVSKSIPLNDTFLEDVLASEPVLNNTAGTIVSPNPCAPILPTKIGF
jgi:hypothetical protein